MKKLTFLAVAIILSIFFVSNCYAQGNAETYKITLLQIQLRKSDGTWITISSPNQEIDIASVNAGATAASLFSSIPAGSYVNFKLVVSETMRFSGSDGGMGTRANGAIAITGDDIAAASTETWTGNPPGGVNATVTENAASDVAGAATGEVTVNLELGAIGVGADDGDNFIEIWRNGDLNPPITVNADSNISMFFDFDTLNTIIWDVLAGVIYFLPPQAGTRFGITVDGTSLTITEAQMRIDF